MSAAPTTIDRVISIMCITDTDVTIEDMLTEEDPRTLGRSVYLQAVLASGSCRVLVLDDSHDAPYRLLWDSANDR